MEPRIQYAKTSDGLSIAFWTLGEGMPVVSMPLFPASHVQLEWQMPELRPWSERLSQKRMLVRYDSRGTGLSERGLTDYSLETHLRDLDAVVQRLGLERFVLFAAHHAGPPAVAYAARHPDRISHLMLWCSYAKASDYYGSRQLRALRALRDTDWEIYTETVAHVLFGWSAGEQARRIAAFMRECTTLEEALAIRVASEEFDVTELLPQVQAPTLVMHGQLNRLMEVRLAGDLAARIPGARLAVLEGSYLAPQVGDIEAVAQAIDEFLGEGEEPAAPAATPSGLVTILFTDIESSTALTQRLGDTKAQELVRTHNSIVRNALKALGGSEIKHTGDGIMASFPTASQALQCAVAIQQAVAAQADTPLRVRVGLNAGEPVAEEQDLFGTAVQLARRICDHGQPGEILVSNVVRELAAGKGFLFSDRGPVALRGFDDPVKLWEVRWQEDD